MKIIPDTRRSDSIHRLWLTLIAVAARDSERFEPTAAEQADIGLLSLRTALTPTAVEHLTDQARRFCQVQAEIQSIGDPLPDFNRAGAEIRKLTNEARAAALEWQRLIMPLERQRLELGQAVTRAAALRAESESLQQAVYCGGTDE